LLFSDAQDRQDQAQTIDADPSMPMPTPFDRSAEIEWSPVWSLRDERFKISSDQPVIFFS